MEDNITQEITIDLVELIKIVLRKWWLITLFVIVFGLLTSAYAFLVLEDEYTAESSMIVQVTNSGDNEYTNLLTGQRLVDTYTEITKSNRVLNTLKDNLSLDYSNSILRSMISVSSVKDTLIIQLKVTSIYKEETKAIANELVSIVQSLSSDFEGLENVETLDIAQIPISPSGPNRLMFVAVGIVFGGILAVGLVLLLEFLDKKIKTGKDLERSLHIRLLGSIPEYELNEGVNVDERL